MDVTINMNTVPIYKEPDTKDAQFGHQRQVKCAVEDISKLDWREDLEISEEYTAYQ